MEHGAISVVLRDACVELAFLVFTPRCSHGTFVFKKKKGTDVRRLGASRPRERRVGHVATAVTRDRSKWWCLLVLCFGRKWVTLDLSGATAPTDGGVRPHLSRSRRHDTLHDSALIGLVTGVFNSSLVCHEKSEP